jgi:hypothetical protein
MTGLVLDKGSIGAACDTLAFDVAAQITKPMMPGPAQAQRRSCSRLMRGAVGILMVSILMSGCVQESVLADWQPDPTLSLSDALNEFDSALSAANTIDRYCRGYRIQKIYTDSDQMTAKFVADLLARGYTLDEIQRAAETARRTFYRGRLPYFDDAQALCLYARQQIASGTKVGRLLRTF